MKSHRIKVPVSPQAVVMVQALLKTGLWGRSVAEVTQRLLYQGLQRLVESERVRLLENKRKTKGNT